MARLFQRTRQGITAEFEQLEAELLRGLVAELVELLDDDPAAGDAVLVRLFPPGYRDDPAAAADLRSMIEGELRAGKIAAAQALTESLADPDHVLLDDETAEQWLTALNDLRLALGTRLDVTEDTYDEFETMAEDDPAFQSLHVYSWLGWLQETLLQALTDGPADRLTR